uniref:Uncharacterized protein n=1 Tax=Podarcis muralis TaxID=64176 RepID=A0A670IL59_PODMU
MAGALLAVEGLQQHQLQEFAAALEVPQAQPEVLAGAEAVALHRVGAHVGVVGALDGEAGARQRGLADVQPVLLAGETGRMVVDVQHLHLHAVHLDGLLDHQLQAEEARRAELAQRLPVHALLHHQQPAAHVQRQVLPTAARRQPGAPRRQLPGLQRQVVRHAAHHGAPRPLLLHCVAELPDGRGILDL